MSEYFHASSSSVWKLYGAVALIPFFSVADQALGHLGLLPTSPTTLCIVMTMPFIAHVTAHHIKSRTLSLTLKPWRANALPLIAFLLLATLSLLLSSQPGAYWDEGGKWIFLMSYGFIVTALSVAIGLNQPVVTSLRFYSGTSLLLIGGSLWYDLLHPGTFSEIQNRAAGFSGNANYTALISVFVCSVGIDFGKSPGSRRRFTLPPTNSSTSVWPDFILLLLCFAIIAMTMSRSGLVAFSSLAVSFIVLRFFRSDGSNKMLLHLALAGGMAAFAIISTLPLLAREISASDRNNRLSRYLHGQQIDDGSAGTRLAAVMDSVRLIEEAPLLGHGTGFSRTMLELPHNLYLQQWVNNGVLGLICYLTLLLSSFLIFLRRGCRNGQVLILVATVGSIFSHNVLDQRPFLILLGILLGASLAGPRRPSKPMSRPLRRIVSRHSSAPLSALVDRAIHASQSLNSHANQPE